MEKKIQTRVILIGAVMLVCLFGIIGFPRNVEQLKQNVRDRIRLGLDLKGGTHLILQVHVEDAVNVTSDQALERLRDELKAKNIPYSDCDKTDSTHLVLKGVPQDKAQDVQALASQQFSDWDLARGPIDPATKTQTFTVGLKTSEVATIRSQALEQARTTIENRINQLGLTEPVVADYGTPEDFELVVELPGVDDFTRVRDIIQNTALLELKIVRKGPYPSKEAALADNGGVLPLDSELLPGPSGQNGESWYLVNRVAAITGRDLTGAQTGTDSNGRPNVLFNLNRDGAARFERETGQNIGKLLAVVLDHRVVEAPIIHGQISDRGQIEGSFTVQQAADLALVLRSGALPASVTYLQEATVGPSLGADSIRHGVIASIVGLLAVMTFMLIYYRGAGINADLALILNLLILIATLAYFGATLTLPGIAGVILTVGMGVDSNVLIFERIREELRAGKAVGAAVSGGFEHAFKTIIDTHVTTVVSAAILFTFGTGPIKGFAVTLTIGLVANLFTSVFVSRVIFDYGLSQKQRGATLSI
jgi:preprotein translocase subunit SecD